MSEEKCEYACSDFIEEIYCKRYGKECDNDCDYKHLTQTQQDLKIANKMIELILQYEYEKNKSIASYDNLYQMYKQQAIKEVEGEISNMVKDRA